MTIDKHNYCKYRAVISIQYSIVIICVSIVLFLRSLIISVMKDKDRNIVCAIKNPHHIVYCTMTTMVVIPYLYMCNIISYYSHSLVNGSI